MISITILVYSCLVLKVFSQEVSDVTESRFVTESPTPTPTSNWDLTNQQNIQGENTQFNRNDQFQTYLPPQYAQMRAPFQGLPYGARLQFENRNDTFPSYFPSYDIPLDAFSVNWTDNDNSYNQAAAFVQYPQTNGIFPIPGMPFFPQRTLDSNRYSLIDDVYNPSWQNENSRSNWTVPPPIIYSETNSRRQNRKNAPALINNFPSPNFIQRRYSDVQNNERAFPYSQYPIHPVFLPPSSIGSTEDRYGFPELDAFGRPHFDRESGTEGAETATIKNAPQVEKTERREPTSAESPVPAETIPRRQIPNRSLPPPIPVIPPYSTEPVPPRFLPSGPFPFHSFPYGMPIPPPELVSPFSFPARIPPTIPPPILPNIPVRPTENIPPPVLKEPSPALPPPEVVPDVPLPPPIENRPVEEVPEGDLNSVNKSPYEFGYEMNDGRGTGQHRKEYSDGLGTVTGSYGYRDAYGVYRLVEYFADKTGFHANIKSNEPGISNPGSADVRVEAEVPPPKAIAESLGSIRVNAVEVPNEPPLPIVGEKK